MTTRALALGLFLVAVFAPVQAQSDDPRLDSLIDELNTLLERGERDRLIDPWFLRDLRAALDRYDWPWRRELLFDDFSGQGPGPDAPWRVTRGEMLLDWRHGLRSVVEFAASAPQAADRDDRARQGDAAQQLLGAILQQALRPRNGDAEADTAPAKNDAAAAQAVTPITNAFAIAVEFSMRPLARGRADGFELGPYQGADARAGYRLSYAVDAEGTGGEFRLLSLSPRGGVATLETGRETVDLVDGAPHRLVWTRDRDGSMTVSMDDREILRVRDRGFRDPFDGLVLVNRGGDLALRSIRIEGVE